MKIKFDPNLDFQKQAIESVAGVFEGQSGDDLLEKSGGRDIYDGYIIEVISVRRLNHVLLMKKDLMTNEISKDI